MCNRVIKLTHDHRFEVLILRSLHQPSALPTLSESKALCHPSSVDSLPTSTATEDHVSMGGWAARKALRVVEHVEQGYHTTRLRIHLRSVLLYVPLVTCGSVLQCWP